jgi:hypothetical protein
VLTRVFVAQVFVWIALTGIKPAFDRAAYGMVAIIRNEPACHGRVI